MAHDSLCIRVSILIKAWSGCECFTAISHLHSDRRRPLGTCRCPLHFTSSQLRAGFSFWCSLRTWLNPFGLFWRGTVDPDILFICWAMGVLKRFIELKFLGISYPLKFSCYCCQAELKINLGENLLVNSFQCTDVGYYRKYKTCHPWCILDWDLNQVLCLFFDFLKVN